MDSKVNCLQVAKDKIFVQLATDATAKNPQNCNDSHIETAVKKALKEI